LTRLSAGAAIAVLAAAGVLVGAVVHGSHGSTPSGHGTRPLAGEAGQLPPPERPAFTVRKPKLLGRRETAARYAPVTRAAVARSAPDATAPEVAPLPVETTEGTTNIVLVIEQRRRGDALWAHVRLPVLPNDRTGWVPRRVLGGYGFVHTHLVVDRERLVATLYRDGRKVFTAPVGVGKALSPTPGGQFYVRDRLSGFGDPFYGPVAFGTSARSAVLTDWPAGGFVGIHGTNGPGLIPGRISHGCIRLRNQDVARLSRLMPVGTPLTIR
jgi:lipoprotein-anchoring transpeptidase ErfK/SrfK